jgi:rod shape-determining protein MreD
MIRLAVRYGLAYAFLILFQVLILNNLHLSIYINLYAYILFILILPFETPGWLVLSLAFMTGLTMDAFTNTMGMHSASIVLLAFVRQYLLKVIAPRDGYEAGFTPHYGQMGLTWFLLYAGILTLIHHLTLFIVEDFSLDNFFRLLLKSTLSALLSLTLMTILLLVSYKPRR